MPASSTPTGTTRSSTRDLQPRHLAPADPSANAPETPAGPRLRRRTTGSDRARRLLDIVASLTALVLLSPLLVLIAAGIRLSSPGPIFYHQVRVGLNRRRGSRRDSRASIAPGDRRARPERRSERAHGSPGGDD